MTTAFIAIDDGKDYGEIRYDPLGFLGSLLHSLTFTVRGDAVHAISLRKATRQERHVYAESY